MISDKLVGFLIGFPLGAVIAWVWYEISGLWPRWVMRCDAQERLFEQETWVTCGRCGLSNHFSAYTINGGLAHRMAFVRRHAFCVSSIDDLGMPRGR